MYVWRSSSSTTNAGCSSSWNVSSTSMDSSQLSLSFESYNVSFKMSSWASSTEVTSLLTSVVSLSSLVSLLFVTFTAFLFSFLIIFQLSWKINSLNVRLLSFCWDSGGTDNWSPDVSFAIWNELGWGRCVNDEMKLFPTTPAPEVSFAAMPLDDAEYLFNASLVVSLTLSLPSFIPLISH